MTTAQMLSGGGRPDESRSRNNPKRRPSRRQERQARDELLRTPKRMRPEHGCGPGASASFSHRRDPDRGQSRMRQQAADRKARHPPQPRTMTAAPAPAQVDVPPDPEDGAPALIPAVLSALAVAAKRGLTADAARQLGGIWRPASLHVARSPLVSRKSGISPLLRVRKPVCTPNVGLWRSLVARPSGGRKVAGSSPASPTNFKPPAPQSRAGVLRIKGRRLHMTGVLPRPADQADDRGRRHHRRFRHSERPDPARQPGSAPGQRAYRVRASFLAGQGRNGRATAWQNSRCTRSI